MVLEKIIAIVIIGLIVIFVWGIFKKLFKVLFYVGIVIVLLIVANSYFIYKDITDLKENFQISTKKIILVDKDEVLTGFLLNGDINYITIRNLEEYSSLLESKDYDEILGESYKLIIFDINIISDLKGEIGDEDNPVTQDYATSILKSGVQSNNVKADIFKDILTNNILSSRNPLFFFSEFKKGNIIIYPETALFKTLKFIPLAFIKNTGKKIFETTKEKAKTLVTEK